MRDPAAASGWEAVHNRDEDRCEADVKAKPADQRASEHLPSPSRNNAAEQQATRRDAEAGALQGPQAKGVR
eukprot:CAMPEP_0115526102 /NCGR_PEP_ID=MMETSP0271-20121206/82114_1 /TAXON_ID=71861 /ORGANISM="Scrippsiella trochoidea, Strain CCMP3099" /LENGTH=70 /DNA_ID=CAMNT_0002957805 /DNA_START=514 /DNA_END=727 /DNA_ORIENTATION=-